ncbi:helix-turn-helix domain-containing protein [Streptomyces sp. SID13666]|uniref:helix-turn-helix domain-containing protein n=1 Tax=unclassified Streptomyces TaxID=2593676 RepID=UPI0013BEEAA3|nr:MULTISPECIES: helix-turn-helix domain-containing protein [unclassified Streptomyces]NEA59410.1 helix-turn-helix domain-containing protein [Streptomyces sp. SID13666]NEA72470.1 helix-turn-helix domain-containing protein [Streptomyces sp. SID13588]
MRGGSNKLLTPLEAAQFLAVSLSTFYSNWRRWGIKAHRVGKHLRFRERDLESWLELQVA